MEKILKYNIDIDKISQYLQQFKSTLENIYTWESPTDKDAQELLDMGLINENSFEDIVASKSYFTRNVILKLAVSQLIREKSELIPIASNWIVSEWGGIRTNSKNGFNEKVNSFLDLLDSGKNVPFDNIASLSKVGSFWNPNEYIIYDSRVAYALNWIMLKTNASEIFFPMPNGRNTKMIAFNVDGLIRLKNKERYMIDKPTDIDNRFISNRDKLLYIPDQEAYLELCQLLKAVNEKLWNDNNDKKEFPFYTEMILFAIADREVLVDIIQSCSLRITD